MYFNVDTLMVSSLKGDVATGLYAVAFTFFMVAISLAQPCLPEGIFFNTQEEIDNSERAINVIATTEGAVNEVNALLTDIQALVVEATR